jgi:release factor glutamine methyltransferase
MMTATAADLLPLHPREPPSNGDKGWGATTTLSSLLPHHASRLHQALNLERREARLEAQILAARALKVDRAWLIAHDRDVLPSPQITAMEDLIARRERGEPVAYVLGEKEFHGRMFKVTPDVLIPRPETELLVETALARLPADLPTSALDLGTGSGCIAVTLALERPKLVVSAADLSTAALTVAGENAVQLGAHVELLTGDGLGAAKGLRFNMIVSNPPYIGADDIHLQSGDLRFEPRMALSAGRDGLDVIRRMIVDAPSHLDVGGWLLIEHGWNQGDQVIELMLTGGFREISQFRDLQGHTRVTGGRRP